jgi:hypothetical protein
MAGAIQGVAPIAAKDAQFCGYVAPVNFLDMIEQNEKREDMIDAKKLHGKVEWNMFLTGGQGYVGRDGITSGAIFSANGDCGRPYIQTPDLSFPTHDVIHHKQIKAIAKMFETGQFPSTLTLGTANINVETIDKDLYLQGHDEEGFPWTVFRTYKVIFIGYSKREDLVFDETFMKKMYIGMRRVSDFLMIHNY